MRGEGCGGDQEGRSRVLAGGRRRRGSAGARLVAVAREPTEGVEASGGSGGTEPNGGGSASHKTRLSWVWT
jgi:hypothetical protein